METKESEVQQFIVPLVKLNEKEYVIDPNIEATQLIIQAVTKYGVEINPDEEDEVVGKKLLSIIFSLMKDGKLGEVLSYLFTPKGEEWSVDKAKGYEPEFGKIKPREVMDLIPSFFAVISGKSLNSGA